MAPLTTILSGSLGEPFYTGSVQRLYAIPDDDAHMVTETTSRGSVFDVGSIFEIPGSDVSRAVFRHILYSRMEKPALWEAVAKSIRSAPELDDAIRQELLQGPLEELLDYGARTHHAGMIDALTGEVATAGAPENPSNLNVVRRYRILKPEPVEILGTHLFDYARFPRSDGYVIPLEYIVRFGITGASSIYRKYLAMNDSERRSYQRELGVSKPLEAWQMLEKPISDCTTKFEPEDRNLSRQEALLVSGLTGEHFADSLKLALLGSWAVRHLVEEIGLVLWDIKWEFAKDDSQLVFVDTIDTDSFRATRFYEHDGQRLVVHFNKQSIRDYYRILHAEWMTAVNETKKQSKIAGTPFTEILIAGQKSGTYPETPEISDDFQEIQVRKMELIRDYMLGRQSPAGTSQHLEACARDEIAFYEKHGKLAEFTSLNQVT